jgi:lipopolysaccharide biosynthesis glycosyltransferase
MSNNVAGSGSSYLSSIANSVHIVCASDAKYGPYAGVMLSSVLRSNPDETFRFHVLSDGMRLRDIRRIRSMAARAGSEAVFYDVAPSLDRHAETMKATHHFSRAVYARLFVDRYLPEDVRRVIYLDSDIVCRAPLRDLWTATAQLELLAAVPEKIDELTLAETKSRLGMPPGSVYFNSGVLVLNLTTWREVSALSRMLACLNSCSSKIRWPDQDVINAVLGAGHNRAA